MTGVVAEALMSVVGVVSFDTQLFTITPLWESPPTQAQEPHCERGKPANSGSGTTICGSTAALVGADDLHTALPSTLPSLTLVAAQYYFVSSLLQCAQFWLLCGLGISSL